MPTEEQKMVIENLQQVLRVVDENGPVISGSFYFLSPVAADWDARLKGTAEIIKDASMPGKTLHLLQGCGTCPVSSNSGFNGKSFGYGRMTDLSVSTIDHANLYGSESVSAIANWVLFAITKRVPNEAVIMSNTSAQTTTATSAFSNCLNSIATCFAAVSQATHKLRMMKST